MSGIGHIASSFGAKLDFPRSQIPGAALTNNMPYLSPIKRRAYARRWRKRNPGYMAEYGRVYYALGKKARATPHAGSGLKTTTP